MPHLFKKYIPARNLFFTFGEGAIIFTAVSLATFVYEGGLGFAAYAGVFLWRSLVVTAICQVCLYYFDLYELSQPAPLADVVTRAMQALGFACIFLAFIYYVYPAATIPLKALLAGYVIVAVSIAAWRLCYALVLDRRMFTESILIVGAGELAASIAYEIESKRDSGFQIVGLAAMDSPVSYQGPAQLFRDPDLDRLISTTKAEKIVVALDDRRGKMPIRALLECRLSGLRVIKGIEFYEELAGKILVEKTNPTWLVYSEGFRKSRLHRLLKRSVDIGFALLGLLCSLPVFLLTSLAIKIDSRGPVF